MDKSKVTGKRGAGWMVAVLVLLAVLAGRAGGVPAGTDGVEVPPSIRQPVGEGLQPASRRSA